MSIVKYLDRLLLMDKLICRKATGDPNTFSGKVGICKSKLLKEIKELKEFGLPIEYDKVRRTYHYKQPGSFLVKFTMHEERKQ